MCMQHKVDENIHDVFDKLMAQQDKVNEQKRRSNAELMAEWRELEKKVLALNQTRSVRH